MRKADGSSYTYDVTGSMLPRVEDGVTIVTRGGTTIATFVYYGFGCIGIVPVGNGSLQLQKTE